MFFPAEAKYSAGTPVLHKETPKTALSALIRVWEQGKLLSSLTAIPQAGVQSPPRETAQKRNTSAGLQNLAFESVGIRKV